jgi:predicted amidohydrolase
MRVGACQILTFADPALSADKVVEWMERAEGEGVEVVAFPEACLCGYVCDEGYWEGVDPEAFARAEKRVVEAAARLGLGVVLGTVHWEEGRLFNSLLAIDRSGEVKGRYAKTHLAENWPVPGRALPVYRLGGALSCFIVCHDIRYPELVRLPAACGAQVCYYISNESGMLAEYKLSAYRAMPIARATENGIFLVMANAPGNPDGLHLSSQSHGNSKIVHPDGNVLCEAGHFEERLVVAELDLDAATGGIARRAVEDETVLREWMRQGVKLVTGDLE